MPKYETFAATSGALLELGCSLSTWTKNAGILLSSGGNEQEDNRTARRGQSYKDRSGTVLGLVQGWVCDGRRRKDD